MNPQESYKNPQQIYRHDLGPGTWNRHAGDLEQKYFDEESEMLNEIETLLQANRTEANLNLLKAARKLCKTDYKHYKANRKRADKLYQMS